MDSDLENPTIGQPSPMDNVETEAQTIAEEAGIDFELFKPMLVQRNSAPSIKQEILQDIKPDIGHVTQPDIKAEINKLDRPKRVRHESALKVRQVSEDVANFRARYNLRRSRRRDTGLARREGVWTNDKLKPDCIREKALTIVVFDQYHENAMPEDEYATKILELSKKTQLSQVDKFIYDNRQFIISSWLSVIRIYEFDASNERYVEIRRMPRRHISIKRNLITCVHYSDAKLFIGYIGDESSAYVEIRSIKGNLLEKPYCYDNVIKSIHSNEDFIFIKTVQNVIYLHKKKCFSFNPYCIDLSFLTPEPIIGINALLARAQGINHLKLIAVTSRHLLILRQDGLSLSILQSYNFNSNEDGEYKIISMHCKDNLIIIHRNSAERSKLEFGSLCKARSKKSRYEDYFVHEQSIAFEYQILQVGLSHDDAGIFLLGRTKNEYEIGQMQFSDFRPKWCSRLHKVNEDSKFIAHEGNLAIIQDCQQLYTVIPSLSQFECQECHIMHPHQRSTAHDEHPGLFRNLRVRFNAVLDSLDKSKELDKALPMRHQ